MGLRFTAATAAFLSCSALTTGAAAANQQLGPLPAEVFAQVGNNFTLKVGQVAKPKISRRVAVRDALHTSIVQGPALAISLARVRRTRVDQLLRPGALVWLVSIDPKIQPRPSCPAHKVCHPSRINYFVVAVDAHSGGFLEAAGGYDPKLNHRKVCLTI